MANNVFTHHDGIVNQQTNAQRQGHEGHHVDGKAKQAHEQKSANHCNRQSQPRDDGRAPRVQEQKHDQYRQQSAFDEGFLHVIDRHANGSRAVKNRL